MRCGTDRTADRRADRRPGRTPDHQAGRIAAGAALVAMLASVLAGCSPGGPGHRAGPHQSGIRTGFSRAIVFAGGGGGVVVFAGPPQLSSGSGRPAITVSPIPPALSGQVISMPLDGYEQVATADQNALAQAQAVLVQHCMAERGFVYDVAAQTISGAAQVAAIEADAIGVTSLAQARTFGFARPGQNSPNGTFAIFLGGFAFGQALRQHGPSWTSALTGFTPGGQGPGPVRHPGCLQLANEAIYGPMGAFASPDPVPEIALEAASWTRSDPRILAAERSWSRCMRLHGFRYGTLAQAQDRGWPTVPTRSEVSTAVADVACKTRTNLANTWLAVQAAYQQALIGQNLAALAQMEGHFHGLLVRAENAVASGSLPTGLGGRGGQPGGPVGILVPVTRGSG